ncbi:hypothetical protein Pyn_16281 [Prunus yedoensis var. nudiflora]|uniref:Uncharacterized protein n=1 Tax=Prunus yedoensis var. nudiflora TaxID=2094558 RepID=A0A314YN76_PRUYE|nr:hypothetical protein Pyn_16281 [Prunus yedoensis var. nudiflora]
MARFLFRKQPFSEESLTVHRLRVSCLSSNRHRHRVASLLLAFKFLKLTHSALPLSIVCSNPRSKIPNLNFPYLGYFVSDRVHKSTSAVLAISVVRGGVHGNRSQPQIGGKNLSSVELTNIPLPRQLFNRILDGVDGKW